MIAQNCKKDQIFIVFKETLACMTCKKMANYQSKFVNLYKE